jgi:glycosyltransferase involved in cell wall biosynthesis
MRVLVVHNRYRSALPSGENMVVDREIAMLRDASIEVDTYIRDSDEIEHFGPVKRAELAVRPIYSLEDSKAFKARIRSFRPDVVHLHNPYPLISPAVIRVAKTAGVPVVQTVHNYRFVCANGLYFRDGRVCQDCLGKQLPWPAVRHSCYRGSMPQSAIMAGSLAVHRTTWQMVDRFLPVSDFVAEQLVAAGVPPEKITVKPNAAPDPGEPAPIGEGFLFAGRLEEEKGIKLLLEAWSLSLLGNMTTLTIVGDGVERSAVQQAASVDPSISYLGSVAADEVGQLLDQCAVRVVPSLWFEAAPLAVIESFARGRPVISTGVGANASAVGDEVGWVCPTTSAVGLAETIRHAFGDQSGARVRGMAARSLYERSYLPGEVTRSLLEIYDGLERARASATANPFLGGECLYGEDLGVEEIARWVADEREAYADLGPGELPAESYGRGRFDHWSVLRGGQAPAAGAGQRSMRILLVLGHSFPTQQALWEEVSRRDLDLHVAYTLDIPRGGAVGPPDFGTRHELAGVRIRGDRLTWMGYRGLSPLVKDLQPDLVHVLNEPWSVAVLQAIRARAGHVVTHGCENLWDQGSPLEAMARRHATRRNLSQTSGFVSWNSEGVAWARRWGLSPASRTLVLSAELPRLERFSHPERRRAAGRGRWEFGQEFVVGYVGRLVAEKGIDWLLESWRSASLPDHARLVFIGQGPMEGAIRAAATADARIRLKGPVSFEQVPTVMASLDALVLPSLTTRDWSEQYGRVITEAMASGVPVIASDSGAIPDVVGDAGIIVSEGSVAELAATLRRVSLDPVIHRALAEAGLARAQTAFSPAVQAERLHVFWRAVAEPSCPAIVNDDRTTSSGGRP